MNEHAGGRWSASWPVGGHLSDESLVELHSLRATRSHARAARYLAHVRRCERCAAALAEVEAAFGAMTSAAKATADQHVSQDRLDRQLDVITRRLDGHPGRLLHFPGPAPAVTRARSSASRWVAMAAACGLLFGLAAGRLIGPAGPPVQPRLGTWSATAPGVGATPQPANLRLQEDEHLLFEIDAALAQSQARAFRVLDDLTPRLPESGR